MTLNSLRDSGITDLEKLAASSGEIMIAILEYTIGPEEKFTKEPHMISSCQLFGISASML